MTEPCREYNPGIFTESHWEAGVSAGEQRRIDMTADAVPREIRTLADIGGADGRLVKAIGRRGALERGLVVDSSGDALRRAAPWPAVLGTCVRLPLADGSIECAACCEVLEHLPDALLGAAVAELKRISSRYIVVTVPFEEQLERNYTRCTACGAVFNINGHLQVFSLARIAALFEDWQALRLERLLGNSMRRFSPRLLRLKQETLQLWAYGKDVVCPRCGTRGSGKEGRPLVRRVLSGVNLLASPSRSAGGWILAVFRRP